MSTKLEQLTQRMCDLVGTQVTKRNEVRRLLDELENNAQTIGALQVAIADEQGRLMLEKMLLGMRGSMNAIDAAEAVAQEHAAMGEQPDLAMFSGLPTSLLEAMLMGTPICVECRKGRMLDDNGRCSECAGMVAGAAG